MAKNPEEMFTLANKYTFAPNPEMCWLSACVSSSAGKRAVVSWSLKAHSQSSSIRFRRAHDERNGISESVAFGIECNSLSFDVLDWRELTGRSFEMDPNSLQGQFIVFQWEGISALNLTFGGTRGKTLELQADGRGYVESAQDYFGTDEIEFSIQTWLHFTGVHTEVPINATAPIAFAEAQIKHLFPKYQYTSPKLIETKDAGRLLGLGVHFPPLESRSS